MNRTLLRSKLYHYYYIQQNFNNAKCICQYMILYIIIQELAHVTRVHALFTQACRERPEPWRLGWRWRCPPFGCQSQSLPFQRHQRCCVYAIQHCLLRRHLHKTLGFCSPPPCKKYNFMSPVSHSLLYTTMYIEHCNIHNYVEDS